LQTLQVTSSLLGLIIQSTLNLTYLVKLSATANNEEKIFYRAKRSILAIEDM